MNTLPAPEKVLRLAMLGMVEGNGHPYSWSAIFNGYDPDSMARCPYPAIPRYLGNQPAATAGITGARVTHLWTDNPEDAPLVARASLIPHVVQRPEDVIGQVDAGLIATDIGSEHISRCRAFVEAGIPIFIDKPMVDNEADLQTFLRWEREGARILSSSCMRYAREFASLRNSSHEMGEIRYASVTTAKSWERYGIHALEAIFPIVKPGFISGRNTGEAGRDMVHFKHRSGLDVCVAAVADMAGGFGALQICGTQSHVQVSFLDTFHAFKAQLESFVDYVRTGVRPFPFAETVELMRMVICGIVSRREGGREVLLEEIASTS